MSNNVKNDLFSLRWNDYQPALTSAFKSMRSDEDFVDVTLGCEGKRLPSHRILLSACSPYFRDLLKGNPCQHPIIILRETKYEDLKCILEFMYQGEISIEQGKLDSFLRTAESLKIRGLMQENDESVDQKPDIALETENMHETNLVERGMRKISSFLVDQQQTNFGPSSQKRFKSDRAKSMSRQVSGNIDSVFKLEEMEDVTNLDDEPQQILLTGEVERGQDLYAADETEVYDEFDTETGDNLFSGERFIEDSVDFPRYHCGVDFIDLKSWNEHILQCHPKHFTCEFCPKYFKQKTTLRSHMALHEGRTKCAFCRDKFSCVSALKRHLIRIHNLKLN